MEYRRKKSKERKHGYSTRALSAHERSFDERGSVYRQYVSGSKKSSASSVQGLLALIMPVAAFAAVAYLLLGTSLRDRLMDKVNSIGIFDRLPAGCAFVNDKHKIGGEDNGNTVIEGTPSSGSADTAAPSESDKESVTVALPRLSLYMLQMGVYSSESNCMEQCASLQSMGAAGYIYNDNGSFRVIASAYCDKSAASEVCSRLNGQGYACTLYEYNCSGAELLITTEKSRLMPIETAFAFAKNVLDTIEEASMDFDSETRSIDYELIVLNEISKNAESAALGIFASAQSSDLILYVYNYIEDINDEINALLSYENCESRTTFSSMLKQLVIKSSMRYSGLLQQICG